MDGNELKREYENYRMLMYSGGYDPVTFEEWQGIMYPVEPPVNWRKRAERAEAALELIFAALAVVSVRCPLQPHERWALEEARKVLRGGDDA